jgi:SPP1 family predicted phage head-tail adaptor
MPGFQIARKDDIEPFAEYFDRRIVIQAEANTSDSQGGKTAPTTWTNIANSPKWAHMEPWKGRVVFEGQQPFAHSYQRILVRYKKTVNVAVGMRVVYKSRIFLIRFADVPVQARKVIEIVGEELQAKGSVA